MREAAIEMVRRFAWKRYAYVGFALLMLLMCWESSRANAMLFTASKADEAGASVIPAESIRLRILANSDAPADQWIKREVRDAVIAEMSGWVQQPDGLEAARETIRKHLPELEAVVGETLQQNGFDYTYQVELGLVPFPTKMYGNQVYPAGDYEALRISIGAAAGQNWWCVLFPPLCFVDSEMVVKKQNKAHAAAFDDEPEQKDKMSASKSEAAGAEKGKSAGKEAAKASKTDAAAKQIADATQQAAETAETAESAKPEVRFFLWDMMKKVASLFA